MFQVNPFLYKLKCYYSTMSENPLLVLAPAKIEELHLAPQILLFHNIISDREVKIVKNLSIPKVCDRK